MSLEEREASLKKKRKERKGENNKNCVHTLDQGRQQTNKHKRKDILLILGYNADIYYIYKYI